MVLIVTITALAITILVLAATISLTRTTRRQTAASLLAGALAGAFEIGVDTVASRWGLWHYPGYWSFGPIGFYVAAAIGYAALGLIAWRLNKSRYGWKVATAFLLFLGIYGPIRDRFMGNLTGLFEMSQGIGTNFADAILIWVIPTSFVWLVIEQARDRVPRMDV